MKTLKKKEFNSNQLGWVKLGRGILDSPIIKNPILSQIYMWCLLKANHQANWVPLKVGKGITTVQCNKGQFITGRNRASEELGLPPSTYNNNIKKLKDFGYVEIDANSHYSIITVLNYDCCTDNDPITGQHKKNSTNIERASKEQLMNTNNNYKNENNKELKIINNLNYKSISKNLKQEFLSIVHLIENELPFIKSNYKSLNPAQFKILREKLSYDPIKSKLIQMNESEIRHASNSIYHALKEFLLKSKTPNTIEVDPLYAIEKEAYEDLKSFISEKLNRIASIQNKLSFEEFQKLFKEYDWEDIKSKLIDLEEWEHVHKQKNVFTILNTFLQKDNNIMRLEKGEENSYIQKKAFEEFVKLEKQEKEKRNNEIERFFQKHEDDEVWMQMKPYPKPQTKKELIAELLNYNNLIKHKEYTNLNVLIPLTLNQFIRNYDDNLMLDYIEDNVEDINDWVKGTNYKSLNDVLLNYAKKVEEE